ncbi:hypothetical protein YC2023_080068 [Brassica napus]
MAINFAGKFLLDTNKHMKNVKFLYESNHPLLRINAGSDTDPIPGSQFPDTNQIGKAKGLQT